jgi:hypothetical protein
MLFGVKRNRSADVCYHLDRSDRRGSDSQLHPGPPRAKVDQWWRSGAEVNQTVANRQSTEDYEVFLIGCLLIGVMAGASAEEEEPRLHLPMLNAKL